MQAWLPTCIAILSWLCRNNFSLFIVAVLSKCTVSHYFLINSTVPAVSCDSFFPIFSCAQAWMILNTNNDNTSISCSGNEVQDWAIFLGRVTDKRTTSIIDLRRRSPMLSNEDEISKLSNLKNYISI